MMYNNKLACAIKVDGKVLRESGENVYIPFGSEYSFLIKNLSYNRAQVSITIDGEDIADGSSFVVNANDSLDIERFLRSNDNKGNRFKFIERTAAVEDHRGIDISDGLIRVEFQFEKERPILHYTSGHSPDWSNIPIGGAEPVRKGGPWGDGRRVLRGSSADTQYMADAPVTTSSMSTNSINTKSLANEAGVTVEGSVSDQKFNKVAPMILQDQKHVMVLRLLGQTIDNTPIREAVTVDTRPKCKSCGKVGGKRDKFCTECGTSLEIV